MCSLLVCIWSVFKFATSRPNHYHYKFEVSQYASSSIIVGKLQNFIRQHPFINFWMVIFVAPICSIYFPWLYPVFLPPVWKEDGNKSILLEGYSQIKPLLSVMIVSPQFSSSEITLTRNTTTVVFYTYIYIVIMHDR